MFVKQFILSYYTLLPEKLKFLAKGVTFLSIYHRKKLKNFEENKKLFAHFYTAGTYKNELVLV